MVAQPLHIRLQREPLVYYRAITQLIADFRRRIGFACRALTGHPKLLLLDKFSIGLVPLMAQKIFEAIRNVSKTGMTILLVEQNAMLTLEASHRGYAIGSGAITLSDDARTLATNPNAGKTYLDE